MSNLMLVDSTNNLKSYHVYYTEAHYSDGDEPAMMQFFAEDVPHACEQCMNAEPGASIVKVELAPADEQAAMLVPRKFPKLVKLTLTLVVLRADVQTAIVEIRELVNNESACDSYCYPVEKTYLTEAGVRELPNGEEVVEFFSR